MAKKFGKDFDAPLEEWWETQAEEFYQAAIRANWNPNSLEKPRYGFKKAFLRACRAGALHRAGFNPKSPTEQEAEQRKRELEQEAERQEREAREAEALRIKEKRENENRMLRQLLNDHQGMTDYLKLMGVIWPNADIDRMDLAPIRDRLRQIRKEQGNGKPLTRPELINFCEEQFDAAQG